MDLLAKYLSVGPSGSALMDADIERICAEMDTPAKDKEEAEKSLSAVFALIREVPFHPAPQVLAARMLEQARRKDDMLDTWAALHDRFPDNHTAFRYRLRWLGRSGQEHQSIERLTALSAQPPTDPDAAVRYAELISELRDHKARDNLFDLLLASQPTNTRVRVLYGKTLFSRGNLMRALEVLDPVRDDKLSPSARLIVDRNDRAIAAMEAIAPSSAAASPAGPQVLRNALLLFANRTPREIAPDCVSGISFFTGGLGAGGAERQLTKMALAFRRRALGGRRVHGSWIRGQIEVIVNSLAPEHGKDFYENTLREQNVPIQVTQDMVAEPFDMAGANASLEPLLPLLPRNARFGLDRLTAHFKRTQPDVAYIWQDGAVLTGALAALAAEVPKIAISLRGLPPNLRPKMMKPEYYDMYQALGQVPGVMFSTNSASAADGYADWIGVDRDRFSVIYNASESLDEAPADGNQARWNQFDQRTEGAAFTLGGVFRCTPNKRGRLWVKWAAKLLQQDPRYRFILVGGGEEIDAVRQLAFAAGISDRVIFTGNTPDVGFWLSKMDGLLLLSENEGLPNVLIEAQMAGLPVISTPAGGAAETFEHGQTGYCLSSAVEPDFAEFSGFMHMIRGKGSTMGQAAIRLTRNRHDPDRILSQVMRFIRGEHVDSRMDPEDDTTVSRIKAPQQPVSFDKRVLDAYKLMARN